MPRKLRIEYSGAVYHIISRGNYRKELFLHDKTGETFERTIFEAAERCGWKLCTIDELKGHTLSSFPKYFKRTVQPPLDRGTLLSLCELPSTLGGMRKYQERLKLADERNPRKREALAKHWRSSIAKVGSSAARRRRRHWQRI